MPVAIPQTVRRSLGEEAVVDFMPWMEEWLSESIKEKAVPRDEYREVLSRLDGLEKAVSLVKEEQTRMRVEFREDLGQLRREMNQRFDEINKRFDGMHQRFDEMNQRFESRLDQMSERMLVQTRRLIGSIALFGTILTIMMGIAQFTP
jgi:tetrahydromethanopterin S-methyltransferase subunit G